MKTKERKISINQISKEDLMKRIPEMTTVEADRIIQYINSNGGLKDINELKLLKDMKGKMLSNIKENFTL